MARIDIKALRHSYKPNPLNDDDYALKQVDLTWDDGGAYALLGPSGCGKSTLLNIISGLLAPSEGEISFDGDAVNHKTPDERHIAQVFQFPVIYGTMTVNGNMDKLNANTEITAASIAGFDAGDFPSEVVIVPGTWTDLEVD